MRGVIVGVADLKASDRPQETIATYALGSCLGITCYDRVHRVGGMLHAMLPDSSQRSRDTVIPAMFLDTGIPALLQAVLQLGGDPEHSEFKVFGGARVADGTDFFNIGNRNTEAMMALVHQFDLHVAYWHVGGHINRTITLRLNSGEVLLRMPGRQEIVV